LSAKTKSNKSEKARQPKD